MLIVCTQITWYKNLGVLLEGRLRAQVRNFYISDQLHEMLTAERSEGTEML